MKYQLRKPAGQPSKKENEGKTMTDQQRRDYLIEDMTELSCRLQHFIEHIKKLDVLSERDEKLWHRAAIKCRTAICHATVQSELDEVAQ